MKRRQMLALAAAAPVAAAIWPSAAYVVGRSDWRHVWRRPDIVVVNYGVWETTYNRDESGKLTPVFSLMRRRWSDAEVAATIGIETA